MNLKYRPEIDGLRAIAVISVIFYHAKIEIFDQLSFQGGFIGVDIFFVISGYLITSIILKELFLTGNLSLKKFYERRVRRILPALIIVMLFTIPFAWLYMIPNSLINYSKSIIYSLGFSSNFFFYFSGQLYGEESGLLKPFLHTWSLAIEEQFYILFPLFLIIVFKYFKNNLFTILILFLVLSLVISDYGSKNFPSLNFYTIQSRAWEILAGSIMAYCEIKNGHRGKNKILPSIGLILIIFSILFFKDSMYHPSYITIIPVLGVCLIIWFTNEDEIIFKILSSKVFIGLGLISYSLYLWHYPIFAFDRIINFSTDDNFRKIIIAILILLTSILSYFYIEKFYRNKKIKFKTVSIHLIFLSAILILINLTIINKQGFKERFPKILQYSFENPLILLKKSFVPCHNNQQCSFNEKSEKKIFIVGDSHMASLIYNLKERAVEKDYSFTSSTYNGCLFFPGMNKIEKKTNRIDTKCNSDYFSNIETDLLNKKNSIIIFGGKYLNYFDNTDLKIENEFKKKYYFKGSFKNNMLSFEKSINDIAINNKIILIYPIPHANVNIPKKLINILPKKNEKIKEYLIPSNYITIPYDDFVKKNKFIFEILDNIQNDNIIRIYPHKLFCNNVLQNKCLTHNDEDIFYADNNHLSLKGAEMVNNLIFNEINKIYK